MVVNKIFLIFLLLVGFFLPSLAHCDMVSPDNTTYHIYADAIDAGGVLSVGGIYSLDDTLGEAIATSTSGGVYQVRGGYQAMTSSSLSMSLSTNSVDLGNLSVATVSSAGVVATVTTDDVSGYTLSVASLSGTSLASVADGTVTAGFEEYGLATSGGDGSLVGDNAITLNMAVATSSTPAYNSQTTLTFKASRSAASVSGIYSQNITLQAAVNLTL